MSTIATPKDRCLHPCLRLVCAVWLLPALLLLAAPFAARAQFTYVTNAGTITITGYTGSGGAVGIPTTINGLPVTTIGDSAFYGSTNLTSVAISNSVTSLEMSAFEYYPALTNIMIGSGVTNIGSDAFYNCTSLLAFNVDAANASYSSGNGILFNKLQTTLIQYPVGRTGTYYSIPGNVTNIGSYAFAWCTSLTGITISNGVISIGSGAFTYCTNLTSVTLGSNVTSIGSYAFNTCSSLTSLTISNNVTSLGTYAFQNCSGLTNVMIGNGVTNIGSFAFYSCRSLLAITVDAANASYSSGDGLLFNKTQTTLIQCPGGKTGIYTTPGSVTNIGNWAFAGCANLTSITISNGVIGLGTYSFSSCSGLTNVTLGTNVISIGNLAFYNCSNLINMTISNNVASIGNNAFQNCSSLTNVLIGNSVTSIGTYPFYNCPSLLAINVGAANPAFTSVDGVLFNKTKTTLIECPGGKAGSYPVPGSVVSIGSYAFAWCVNLTSITISNGVTTLGSSVFQNCPSLLAINVDAANPTYSSADGVLFNKNQTTLLQCPGGKAGSYSIPSGVTGIGSYSFYNCNGLTSVTIPNSVTNIFSYAFQNCTNLTSVTIPNGVTNIASYAFEYCSGLTNVLIGNGVATIGSYAFYYCTRLTTVFFQGNRPAGTIGSSVFLNANNPSVYYLPGTTGWGATFASVPAVLWNPVAQTADPAFGVRTNRFGFNITGTTNIPIVVEACTNLANPDWQPLQSVTLTNGSIYFSDPDWTYYPGRFYRIRSP